MLQTQFNGNPYGRFDETEQESAVYWPYRTTPLVLPGAKAKHEPVVCESYLRHHPNPMMRQSPHSFDQDSYMKQKVAENMLHRVVGNDDGNVNGRHFVHKQFNSPIGLYSEPNVVNTIRQQTGASAPKQRPVFDPSRSETLRVLQEEHQANVPHDEISGPAPSKIFNPQQHREIIHKVRVERSYQKSY